MVHLRDLGEEIRLDKNKRHEIDVLVDRVVVKEGAERRITDSLEMASRLSDGIIQVEREGSSPTVFSQTVFVRRVRVQFSRDHPADVLFQQSPGGLSRVRRTGDKTLCRPSIHCSKPRPFS